MEKIHLMWDLLLKVLLLNFVSGFMLELKHISLTESITCSPTFLLLHVPGEQICYVYGLVQTG